MLTQIANRIAEAGGRAFLVGGAVRDQVLGKPSKDLDVEVHGLSADQLVNVLSGFGRVDAVGSSFGVLKVRAGGDDFDFSLPRRENKVGRGHKGFQVQVDPEMTTTEAARRRDFTMNAMLMDVLSGNVVDPFGGGTDLAFNILRMTDAETFAEDSLRVLRGFQFCGRFELTADLETERVCAEMVEEFDDLPVERVWEEWRKWATKSTRPSLGLRFLREVGWLDKFPEVAELTWIRQDARWHPEGDVFVHTCEVVDRCARIATEHDLDDGQRAVLVFAGLCHDFGKVTTTRIEDGRITSHGHDAAGAEPMRIFLARIGAPKWLTEQVIALVKAHMFRAEPTKRNVRRLAVRVQPATVEMLTMLMEADQSREPVPVQASFCDGQVRCSRCHRPLTDPDSVARRMGPVCATKCTPHWQAVWDVARELACERSEPESVLMGRHLLAVGMEPGPEMGEVLRAAFEAQLDGAFSTVDEGVAWVRSR